MAKTVISPSSDEGGAAVYPVFVDTNLDTHLALIVSDTDTVSDLKMKVILEHPQCFPTVGKIKVNALQVKRRGHFYHLSDSMLVKNVFAGAKKSWYVYVDASSLEEQILEQHIGKPDSSNQLALPWVLDSPSYERLSKHHESTALQPDQRVLPAELSRHGDSYGEIPKHVGSNDRFIADNHRRIVSSDSDKRSGLEVPKYDAGSKGIVSKKRVCVTQRDISMEGGSDSRPAARKKHKTERNECRVDFCGEDKVLINGTIDVTSKVDAINQDTFHLQQEKSRNATSASLFAGDLNNDHLSTHSFGQEKKRRKGRKKEKCKILSVTPLKLLESGAEPFLPTETNRGQLDEAYVIEASKECENAITIRNKKKKVKKSAARDEHASVMKHDTDAVIESPSAVPNPASVGRSFDKLQTDECVSFHMERTGLPEEKTADAPHRVPDRGSDDVIRKEVETLQSSERDRCQEGVKEKPRGRRRKKIQHSTAASFQGFPTQEQEGEVDHSHLNQVHSNQECAPRMDQGIDEVTTMVTNVAKSKTSGLEQSSGLKLENDKNNGIEHTSSLSLKIPKDAYLSEIPPSPVIENIVEAYTGYEVNISNGEGEGIDFKQYFVPGENHTEGAPTNKVKETGKLGRLMKSKNKGKVDVPSVGNSHSQQKSLLCASNHGDETSQMKKFTSTQSRGPLSVVENNDIVSSSKKSPEVSVNDMKAPNSHPIDQIKTPKVARQSDVRSDSRVNRSAHAAKGNNRSLVESSSNSESSVRSRRGIANNKRNLSLDQSDMAVGKTAAKNTGEVVNNSKHKKSLLATPGTIFGDDSSNSSADDNGTVDSDASTRTPSDKLLSSESEGESDSSLDSGKHAGSSAATGKGGRNFLVDSQNSDMKEKTFGEILRSSSRFKKAKLTASQFLDLEVVEDIDIVPDSQPNT